MALSTANVDTGSHTFQTWVDNARADGLQDDDSTLIHLFPSND